MDLYKKGSLETALASSVDAPAFRKAYIHPKGSSFMLLSKVAIWEILSMLSVSHALRRYVAVHIQLDNN